MQPDSPDTLQAAPGTLIQIAGEALLARADATLFWPRESTLFVADVHLGKAASFRTAAVPVPVGTTASTLARLSAAIIESQAERVIFLGDLWHAKEGRKQEIIDSLDDWRGLHQALEMILVEGNHDRRAGELPPQLNIRTVLEPHMEGPFALCHYPCEIKGSYCLAGHIHPSVTLRARARQSLNLPCFWFGQTTAVLPAFGDFTGTATIDPAPGDRVYVIADNRVHEVQLR
jgi:DNA ligase-associated metallophosphoesterase